MPGDSKECSEEISGYLGDLRFYESQSKEQEIEDSKPDKVYEIEDEIAKGEPPESPDEVTSDRTERVGVEGERKESKVELCHKFGFQQVKNKRKAKSTGVMRFNRIKFTKITNWATMGGKIPLGDTGNTVGNRTELI